MRSSAAVAQFSLICCAFRDTFPHTVLVTSCYLSHCDIPLNSTKQSGQSPMTSKWHFCPESCVHEIQCWTFFKPSNINADTMSGESFFFFLPHKHEPHSVQWVFIFKNYVWRNIPIKATLTFLTVFCFAAQNVTVEEILSSYKQACQKLNCKPIPKVLKQIQVRLNIIQTHSWHTTDRLRQWCCQPTSDKVCLFVCFKDCIAQALDFCLLLGGKKVIF